MMRQFDEQNKIASDRQAGLLISEIGTNLINLLKKSALKIDNVSILNTASALDKTENSNYSGNIEFTTRVIHGGYNKKLNLIVECKESKYTLPDISAVGAKLDATDCEENITLLDIQKQDEEGKKALAEMNVGLTKTASSSPFPSTGLSEILHVDKTWLPDSLKVDDVVNIDGVKYKIANDSHNKLSTDSDGSFWTLRLISE
jgi:hypothetical protein